MYFFLSENEVFLHVRVRNWSGQQPAGQKLAAPSGHFYSGCCPDHNGQGNSQLGGN